MEMENKLWSCILHFEEINLCETYSSFLLRNPNIGDGKQTIGKDKINRISLIP